MQNFPLMTMNSSKLFLISLFVLQALLFVLQALIFSFSPTQGTPTGSNLFREYIGAQFNNVKFSDVPINPNVDFHFILSFAIDYTTSSSASETNGNFNVFWDTDNLSPSQVSSIKSNHPNDKVALSLGGDSVGNGYAYFNPSSIDSWVQNAVTSLTKIINEYNLDGIDIDYEHFRTDPNTFAECIGQLITTLKKSKTISFASIAPYEDGEIQSHYMALWRKYRHVIDYVNFQFHAYDKGISVSQFVQFFNKQASNYQGGQILASFNSNRDGGLAPNSGFFEACNKLKGQGKLGGIFVWCADESKKYGFQYEKKSQELLAS